MVSVLSRAVPSILLAFILATPASPAVKRYYTVRASATDQTAGDLTAGEDPVARAAGVKALGKLNGAVVVLDAKNGRALTIVNQKLALSDGYIPCSTIKLAVGWAALNEGVIAPQEKVRFPGPWYMSMIEALAISNNVLFDHLGERLGFARFRQWAQRFGFGEKAGVDIPGEQPGVFPETEHEMGVGRMTSFGEGIRATPLQMAAFTAAMANGGMLYYVQHPATQKEARAVRGQIKRKLPGRRLLPDMLTGMREAVRRGTGRNANVREAQVYGKTGTCSEYTEKAGTRLGWFTSYAKTPDGRLLAVTVMLRGGGSISGATASTVVGRFHQELAKLQVSQARRPASAADGS